MLIESIYQKLHDQNICGSGYDFSVRFLGKSPSYYSVIKTRNQNPTTDVLFTLEFSLERKAKEYSSNRYPFFIRTRNRLLQLKKEVRKYREKKIMDDFINFKDKTYEI